MCGIGGVWGARDLTEPARLAAGFGDALAHRGPDGEGFLVLPCGGAPRLCRTRADITDAAVEGVLVHRRLSIIDLATGDQPMSLADGGAWIVFNGEIYNYPALRQEIAALESEPFRTTSDTEVILRVYRRWGVEGFRRLNGMFALALYDARRRRLVLARDPVGIKPLYWAPLAAGVGFASEIRPLLATELVARTVAPERLAQFLYYRFVPAPGTLWRGVHKVTPGHALCFLPDGTLEREVDFAEPAPGVRHRARADELAAQVATAIRRQMISDVPVGAFLSGGLDSSIVAAVMREAEPGLPTFAVGFPDEPELPSELHAARAAAAALGTRHRELQLEVRGYFDRLPWAVAQVEEPVAHSGMLLQADLSRLARSDVKVVLTGQGADEPLGGYARHQAARVLPLLAGLLGGVARSRWWDAFAARRETVARVRRVLAAPPGLERAAALFSPLAPEEAAALARGCGVADARDAILAGLAGWWRRAEGLDEVARVLYVDVRTSLAEDLLLVGDKMAMAHSLEARVPYLDLDYLAALEAIPGPERVGWLGGRKRLQRAIGQRLLPPGLARTLNRSTATLRRKRGFDVPVAAWFRGTMGPQLLEFVTGPRSLVPAHVDGARARGIITAYLAGSGRASRMVLALYALEVWLRANFPA